MPHIESDFVCFVTDTVLYVYTSGTTGMPKACKVEDLK